MFFMMVTFGLVSCNYNDLKQPSASAGKAGSGKEGQLPELIDFAMVKEAVFEPACIKCHGPQIAKADLRLDGYVSTSERLRDIRQAVAEGDMPPPPPRGVVLTPEQRELLLAWIDRGGKEFATKEPSTPNVPPTQDPPAQDPPLPPVPPVPPVPPTPPVSTPDFATVSQAVFIPHCIKCHSNKEQKGKVNLETYIEAAGHAADIGETLDTDDMPRRAPPLPPELKAIVYAWIDGGAPETVP